MFTNKTWITNGDRKVKNPAKYQNVTDVYQGNLQINHDWKHQTENFIAIKASLEQFNIYPTEIYLSNRAGKSSFVLCFTDPNIIWNKYEGEGYGSGQNYIYYKSHKIKTTVWICLTYDDINKILLGAEPEPIITKRLKYLMDKNKNEIIN